MITDIISMSASTLDEPGRRTFCVSFDNRINAKYVLEFVGRTAADLIDNPEQKMVIEATLGVKGKSQASKETRSIWDGYPERQRASVISNLRLDQSSLDPDSDFSVVSRQYLRALEKIARLSTILDTLLAESDERSSPIRGHAIDDLQREAADRWPSPSDGVGQ